MSTWEAATWKPESRAVLAATAARSSGSPAGGRVLVIPRVGAGRRGRGHDVGRSREVRLPGAETDDVLAGGDERLGLGVDGQGGRFGDAGYAL